MVANKKKKATKKVKNLAPKALSRRQAKGVKGGSISSFSAIQMNATRSNPLALPKGWVKI